MNEDRHNEENDSDIGDGNNALEELPPTVFSFIVKGVCVLLLLMLAGCLVATVYHIASKL